MNALDAPPLRVTIRRLIPSLCIVVYIASWIFRFID
jgi:hypothetical protein